MKGLRVFMGICILLISLGVTSPVSADAPVKSTIVRDFYADIPAGWICDFPFVMHSYGEIQIMIWYGKDGSPVKQQELWGQMNQSLTANGKTVNLNVTGSAHTTFPSPTVMILHSTGPISFAVLPGYGPVGWGTGEYKETYNLIDGEWVLVDSTPFHGIWVDDVTNFCAYFES